MRNKNIIAISMVGMLVSPLAANAVQVAGDEFDIYAKLNLSVDISDPDTADSSQTSISSNSSRIGFKGEHKINEDLSAVFQLEQEVSYDETGGTFATRDSFGGLKGGFGAVVLGYADTPFKKVAGNFDLFGDTVGDRRAILGADALAGNKMNVRGENMIRYSNKFNNVALEAMYSASTPTAKVGGDIDNNDNDLTSISLAYAAGPLSLAAGVEQHNDLGSADGTRIAGSYTFGDAKVGLIYEIINSDTATLDRNAYGINGSYKMNESTTLKAQVLVADDYTGVTSSGATMTTIGASNKLDENTEVYVVYTATSNDDNARYQAVDGGHGDEVKTDLGGSPGSLSLGFVYKI